MLPRHTKVELIETLWNVNAELASKPGFLSGINRNIVECKYGSHDKGAASHERINRNIVECKFAYTHDKFTRAYELIETLWNVNEIIERQCDISNYELIETLWNVNCLILPS